MKFVLLLSEHQYFMLTYTYGFLNVSINKQHMKKHNFYRKAFLLTNLHFSNCPITIWNKELLLGQEVAGI